MYLSVKSLLHLNFVYRICLLFFTIFVTISCSDKQYLVSTTSPHQALEVLLYEKERPMHQSPEILIYYKKSKKEAYIDSILLPEDNRNQLNYTFNWSEDQLLITVHCDYCMINERTYTLSFQQKKPILLAIAP